MSDRYKLIDELSDPILGAIFGSPASILLAMMVYYRAGLHVVGVRTLSERLNKDDNTISHALHTLQHYGLVEHNGRRYNGWYLSQGALQLPIMQVLLDEPADDPKSSLKISVSRETGYNESENLRLELTALSDRESQNFSLPAPQPAGVSNFETQNESESQNFSLPPTSLSSLSSSSLTTDSEKLLLLKLAEARKALTAAGCSPDQVESFVQQYPPERLLHACDVYEWARHTRNSKGTGYVANDRGYLINSITRNWTAPRSYVPADRRCAHCYRALSDHAFDCPALQPLEASLSDSPEPTAREEIAPTGRSASEEEPSPRLKTAWQQVVDQLRGGDMRRVDIDTWVAPLNPRSVAGGVVILSAPTTPTRDWVSNRLGKTLENLLSSALEQPVAVQVVVGD